jgi:hypothetical protein
MRQRRRRHRLRRCSSLQQRDPSVRHQRFPCPRAAASRAAQIQVAASRGKHPASVLASHWLCSRRGRRWRVGRGQGSFWCWLNTDHILVESANPIKRWPNWTNTGQAWQVLEQLEDRLVLAQGDLVAVTVRCRLGFRCAAWPQRGPKVSGWGGQSPVLQLRSSSSLLAAGMPASRYARVANSGNAQLPGSKANLHSPY